MQHRERAFQTRFGSWVKYRWKGGPAAFELKRTRGRSLALAEVKDHQLKALLMVESRGLHYKIPDGGYAQSPFDSFFLRGTAYLVVAYGPVLGEFYLIPVNEITRLKESGVVSLTEKMAVEIGERHVLGEREAS